MRYALYELTNPQSYYGDHNREGRRGGEGVDRLYLIKVTGVNSKASRGISNLVNSIIVIMAEDHLRWGSNLWLGTNHAILILRQTVHYFLSPSARARVCSPSPTIKGDIRTGNNSRKISTTARPNNVFDPGGNELKGGCPVIGSILSRLGKTVISSILSLELNPIVLLE